MQIHTRLALVGTLLLIGVAHANTNEEARARGRLILESRCVACHSLDANRVGQAMGYSLQNPQDRQAVVAYLESLVK